MYCQNCGASLEDGVQFCPKCGQQSENSSNRQDSDNQRASDAGSAEPAQLLPKRSINKKTLAAAVALIVALAAVVILACVLSTKAFMGSYINDELTLKGYNGYAYVSDSDVIDKEKLAAVMGNADLSDVLSDMDNSLSALLSFYDEDDTSFESFLKSFDYISVAFDKADHISNGDTVTATITVDYDKINQYHFNKTLCGKKEYTKEYKIKGLDDAVVIDPFEVISSVTYDLAEEDLTINYNTEYNTEYSFDEDDFDNEIKANYYYDGNSKLHISSLSSEDDIAYLTFYADSGDYLSTKKITVTVSCQENDYVDDGIIISPVTKQIEPLTCDYLKDGTKISASDFKSLQEKANEQVQDETNLKSKKIYFGIDGYRENILAFVYSYTHEDSWTGEKSTRYIYVYYENIKINSDGTITGLTDLDPSRSYSDYEKLDDVKQRLLEDDYSLSALEVKKS